MAFFDGAVVNIALGALQWEFGATLVGAQWVAQANANCLVVTVFIV